jgi:hypothetical protein
MLTVLEEALAEAHGLAIAAGAVTERVAGRTEDGGLRGALAELRADGDETRARCLEVERSLGLVADEVLSHANTTNEKAADLAGAWFKAGTGPLAAWSFLAMAEAGEVAAWSAVEALAARSPLADVAALAEWALPLQRRHLELALEGLRRVAEGADPQAPRWG